MIRGRYIRGPGLVGFWGLFESDYGDPSTEVDMATVTPSRVGGVLLPFPCPKCREACHELADASSRACYKDPRAGRKNHWCPRCGCRFIIDLGGLPLKSALPAGATCAPCEVRRGDAVEMVEEKSSRPPGALAAVASAVIGFLAQATNDGGKRTSGYLTLAGRK